jgi:hypothetical protein
MMSYSGASEESKGDEDLPFGPVKNVQLNYDDLLRKIYDSEEYKSELGRSRALAKPRAHSKTVKRQPIQHYVWNRTPHELESGEERRLVRKANNATRRTDEFHPDIYGITSPVDLEAGPNPIKNLGPGYDIESGQVPGGKSRKVRKSKKARKSRKVRKSKKARKPRK